MIIWRPLIYCITKMLFFLTWLIVCCFHGLVISIFLQSVHWGKLCIEQSIFVQWRFCHNNRLFLHQFNAISNEEMLHGQTYQISSLTLWMQVYTYLIQLVPKNVKKWRQQMNVIMSFSQSPQCQKYIERIFNICWCILSLSMTIR